jgi:lipooligosaccharide transport system ATP-binding protein
MGAAFSRSGTGLPQRAPGTIQSMADALVRARALTKRFGDFVAVDQVDFDVQPGEAFGFLGPNGAGKSSTMRMIGAVSPISGGSLSVLGMDPERDGPAIRARLGVVPQENNLDTELPVEENLLVYGRYFGMSRAAIRERIEELLDFAQLTEHRSDVVDHLSGGMKRRLIIARALINQPDLVILDEPTTGLDPQARHALWDRLYRLKQEGATLIVTTHYMDEAEQLCDRLVVMDKGKIVAEGSPRQLIRTHSHRDVIELRFDIGEQKDAVARLDGIAKRMEVLPDRILLYTDDADAVIAAVHAGSLKPQSLVERRSTLEDVFLRLTGRTLVD